MVTQEMLGTLEELPLRANAAVGVSTTVLKQACCKLCLARWGYCVALEQQRPSRPLGHAEWNKFVGLLMGRV